MSYPESINIEIKQWVANKVKSNPKKFGGDDGNSYIIKEYLTDIHYGTKVEDLDLEAISGSVAASRSKNTFLIKNPEYDLRKKNLPKYKKK